MRIQSANASKGKKNCAALQKVPREGTKIRELYDLFQAHKGVMFMHDNLTEIYPANCIGQLTDYYGLDIRNLGALPNDTPGTGRGGSKWILAGEWFGSKYIDYIAKNKQKLAKVEKEMSK